MSDVAGIGIGGIEVIALKDGQMQAQPPLFPDYDAEKAVRAAAQAGIAYDGKTVDISINAFVVRSGDAVVLVDAGSPPGFGEGTGAFGQALAQAGVAPGEVTHLAMTHLHIDHVGGLTDGAGRAVFDNAELISGEGDWRHFHSDEVYAAANSRARQSIDVSRRAVAPYANRRREVSGETGIAPGVSMVPLPGHTPGHCGVLIEDGDAQLLIWGDTIHAEAFQVAEPGWSVLFDADQAQARATRVRLFDRVATDGLMVTGPHVRFPGFSRLERAKTGYRLLHLD
ncbi:MBL fold metallo-hydrolase [Seohaeicola saemankumensis]|nr:MBL fold metallo-hydrolase [Seohaeicola saemankumensis]MCA0872403.1 MBL fold metallo-hydrolase [Seohaeicola saemankumensis]